MDSLTVISQCVFRGGRAKRGPRPDKTLRRALLRSLVAAWWGNLRAEQSRAEGGTPASSSSVHLPAVCLCVLPACVQKINWIGTGCVSVLQTGPGAPSEQRREWSGRDGTRTRAARHNKPLCGNSSKPEPSRCSAPS